MNLLLLEPGELHEGGQALLSGRRARHIQEILRVEPSASLRAGVVGGAMGVAHLSALEPGAVRVRFEATGEPPAPLPMRLILALPRPKVLRRVLVAATSLGIKEIVLLNAYRVEKPYWSSQQVTAEYIRKCCLLGLEQARDTILPNVQLERLFKPFVEDRFPEFVRGTRAFVAHPGAGVEAPSGLTEPVTLVVGPEGGFIPYEVEMLERAGCSAIHLGSRILRFETALQVLSGRLIRFVP
jgi:16S rRNA (uracil1498-N3)-methyltransferase